MPRRRNRASKKLKKLIKEEKKVLRPAVKRYKRISGVGLPKEVGSMGQPNPFQYPKKQVAAMVTAVVNMEHWFEQSEFRVGRTRGESLRGLIPVGHVQNTNSLATPSGPFMLFADVNAFYSIPINPFLLFPTTSQEYRVATTYAKFQFSRLKLHYATQSGANISGSMWAGYFGDAGIPTSSHDTLGAVSVSGGAASIPIWATDMVLDFDQYLSDRDWFYMAPPTTADASLFRGSVQGLIAGVWDVAPSLNFTTGVLDQNVGAIWVEYEVNMIDPVPPQSKIVPPEPAAILKSFRGLHRQTVRREPSARELKEEVVEPRLAEQDEQPVLPSADHLKSLLDELSRLRLEIKGDLAKARAS